MSIRQTITQLYKDYESGNLEGVRNGLSDDFRFEWPFDFSCRAPAHNRRGSGRPRDSNIALPLRDTAA